MGAAARLILLTALACVPARAEPDVRSDARLDLVGLVQLLSGDPHAARNLEADAAFERFERWSRHPAVKGLTAMRKNGFAWDIPLQYALYLSSPPALAEAYPAPSFFAETAGGAAALAAWREDLVDFARVSGFMDWEREREPRRREEIEAVRASAGGADLAPDLIAELGLKPWSSWTVVTGPFFGRGGVGAWVLEEKAGRPEIVVMYGPNRNPRPSPDSPARFAAWVYPEAAFAMAYALYEVCRPAMKPVPGVCEGMGSMNNPEDCVEQRWVRGLVARVVERRFGPDSASEYRAQRPPSKFQDGVDAALDVYDSDRAKYKDIIDARALLAAPVQPDGKSPACAVVSPERFPETVYARRLAYYLDGRLEAHPDSALAKARARLEAFRAEAGR